MPGGRPSFFLSHVRVLATHATPARFRSIVAPIATRLRQGERRPGARRIAPVGTTRAETDAAIVSILFGVTHMERLAVYPGRCCRRRPRARQWTAEVGKHWIAPLHVHHSDDEAWYVLDGELGFRIGEDEVIAAVAPPCWFLAAHLTPTGTREKPRPATSSS